MHELAMQTASRIGASYIGVCNPPEVLVRTHFRSVRETATLTKHPRISIWDDKWFAELLLWLIDWWVEAVYTEPP